MREELAPPLHNGRYQLHKVLGTGGMATVYLARDGLLQVDRAIKVLSPNLSRRRKIRERFLLEARSMAKIQDPNVVRVFDFGQDGDRVFLVMEVVEGGSMMDRIENQGPFPPAEAARLIAGALDGLSAAHAAGYVHRDVKPHNILITSDGDPKLTDFGIAAAQASERNLTRTGTVMGTWAYMAPEQRTDAKRADPRSDLYSMGATLVACVTATEPFDLYVDQVAAELPERMPPSLAAVVQRSTRYSPEERYADAHEMADALRALDPEELAATAPVVPPAAGPAREPEPSIEDRPGSSSETFDPDAFQGQDGDGRLETIDFALPLAPASDTEVELTPPPKPRRWTGPVAGAFLLVAGVALFIQTGQTLPSVEEAPAPQAVSAPVTPEPVRALSAKRAAPPAEAAPAPLPNGTEPPATEPSATEAPAAEPSATEPSPSASSSGPAPPRDEPPAAKPSPAPAAARSAAPERSPPPDPEPPAKSEPPPAKASAERSSAGGAPGRLFLNSEPYSVVSIGGKEVGRTPVRGLELPEGLHKVVFRTATGTVAHHTIEVVSGESIRLCWDIEAGDLCH